MEVESAEEEREPHPVEDGAKVKEKSEEEEEKEEGQKNQPVWMTVKVEQAMHLSDVMDTSRSVIE